MMARSSAATRASGATRQALPRLAMVLALVLATSAVGTSATMAGSTLPTGDIELAAAAARTSAPVAMKYGDKASFVTSVSGRMASQAYVYIRVLCSQDGWIVYQWSSRDLNFEFPLVDQAGDGLEWDGSAADCVGQLMYRVDGKRNIVIEVLDNTEFPVVGA